MNPEFHAFEAGISPVENILSPFGTIVMVQNTVTISNIRVHKEGWDPLRRLAFLSPSRNLGAEYFHCSLHYNWLSSWILWTTNKTQDFSPWILGCHKVLANICWSWWIEWLTRGPMFHMLLGRHLSAPPLSLFCFVLKNSCSCWSLWLSSSSWSSLIISHNLLPGWILLWSQTSCSGRWTGLLFGLSDGVLIYVYFDDFSTSAKAHREGS